jgi:hypothetical protein
LYTVQYCGTKVHTVSCSIINYFTVAVKWYTINKF